MADNLNEQFFSVHNQLVEMADPEVAQALSSTAGGRRTTVSS